MSPLKNARWETYCLARIAGKTQSDACIEAFPRTAKWSRGNLYARASKLEAKSVHRAWCPPRPGAGWSAGPAPGLRRESS
jgi:hypothetical protein